MMSLQQLVDESRAFILDCMDVYCGHVLSDKTIIPEGLLTCIEQLMFSINMTTESLLLLTEHKQVWDATILLRSVLDGSVRVCYLLSAKTRQDEDMRLHEFCKLLPRAEMGGIEQPVSGMIKSPFYKGTDADQDPVLDPIKAIVDQMKPQDGEGKQMRELKTRWGFFHLSKKLCKDDENLMWKDFAPLFEYRYAMSNQLVHKTDTGCGQILERCRRNPLYRSISDLAHSSTLLVSACFSTYVRIATLLKRANADVKVLGPVFLKYENFFNGAQEIEDAFVLEYQKDQEQNKATK